MAHAGTQTDLAKQPATSGSVWKLLFNSIVILAIGLALALAASFLIQASSGPAVDRGFDSIEKARGAWALSAMTADSDAVKAAAAAKARAMSGVPVDTSYNDIEARRGTALSGTTIDPSTFDRTPRGAHGPLP